MRKTLLAAALAIPMALLAVSTFAATPAETPHFFTPAYGNQTRLVAQDLAAEIFLPVPGVAPAPGFAAFVTYPGVCSVTCEECYGPGDCPSYPGMRQYCAGACN
jgi:hypothetical protein